MKNNGKRGKQKTKRGEREKKRSEKGERQLRVVVEGWTVQRNELVLV